MECSYFGLAEHSENCVHECIVTDRCLFWQTLRIVASSLRGDRAEKLLLQDEKVSSAHQGSSLSNLRP